MASVCLSVGNQRRQLWENEHIQEKQAERREKPIISDLSLAILTVLHGYLYML